MATTLIDSHVHLFHEDFQEDLDAVIARAEGQGIGRFIVPATDVRTSYASLDLAKAYGGIFVAVGVHPHDAAKAGAGDLKTIESLSAERDVVAIGEIGLDYHYDFAPGDVQRSFFAAQLDLAIRRELPVIVHTRESMDDAIRIVAEHATAHPNWGRQGGSIRRGVFHCFTGTEEQARRLFDLGFYVSFPGILTFKNSPVAGLFPSIGVDRVLLETDAPYMAPVPFRGKRNEPSYMLKTAERMAEMTGTSLEEIATLTTANTVDLFRLEQ